MTLPELRKVASRLGYPPVRLHSQAVPGGAPEWADVLAKLSAAHGLALQMSQQIKSLGLGSEVRTLNSLVVGLLHCTWEMRKRAKELGWSAGGAAEWNELLRNVQSPGEASYLVHALEAAAFRADRRLKP